MFKVYVGCAIRGLSEKQWKIVSGHVQRIREELRRLGYEVLDFRSDLKRQAEPGTIFKHDYEQCMAADAMIAIALFPSTGMGMEIMSCLMKKKPAFVLAVAPKGNGTTAMVKECGLPGFEYFEFRDWKQVVGAFHTKFTLHLAAKA